MRHRWRGCCFRDAAGSERCAAQCCTTLREAARLSAARPGQCCPEACALRGAPGVVVPRLLFTGLCWPYLRPKPQKCFTKLSNLFYPEMAPYGLVGAHIKTGKRYMAQDNFQTPPDPKRAIKIRKGPQNKN